MTRISLAHLNPEQREAVRRQQRDGATIVPVAAIKGHGAQHGAKSVHTATGAKRGMSALEKRFVAYLERLKLVGEISAYAYELCRVTLKVKRSTKKPDFWVRCATWRPDGDLRGYDPIVVVEVKPTDKRGRPYFGPGAKMLVKLGAERLAEIGVPVFVAYEVKHDGMWCFERVLTVETT